MKVKPAPKPGQVVVQLDSRDERLLEQSARAATTPPFRLRRILVPVDFSECSRKALRFALPFARQFQARLVLVHVVEPMIVPENLVMAVPELPEAGSGLVKDAQTRLEKLGEKEIPTEARGGALVRVGRPFQEIIEAANEEDADLIIIATHGYTGLKHVLLGSTAERVVRHAPCPVLTVRATEADTAAPTA